MQDFREIQDKIIGVEFKSLLSYGDKRGFFREIIRESDAVFTNASNFSQWSHSKMAKNTVKAWHYHHLQTDWWYIAIGLVQVVLVDNRKDSKTKGVKIEFLLSGESNEGGLQVVVKIPPGVLHGCKVLSPQAHLFYITSRIYDPNDEGRIPFNSPLVSHSWGNESELIVADNDKKEFVPKSPCSD